MAVDQHRYISQKRKEEYKATYNKIIKGSTGRNYQKRAYERHHIIPRSLGGGNDKSNIVFLTYREHFIVHWLLTKFSNKNELPKMLCAFGSMTRKSADNSQRIFWQSISRICRGLRKSAKGHVFAYLESA